MRFVSPSSIAGEIDAYPSKSEMQRAVLAASLSVGESTIRNPSYADDGKSSLLVARRLGASVIETPSEVKVSGCWDPSHLRGELPCGESGLLSRMLCSIAAHSPNEVSITGTGTLCSRTFEFASRPLRSLGCEVSTTNGRLPIHIRGPIKGGKINIDGSITSQFLSGLLFALPLCGADSTLKVKGLVSEPYVNLTLSILKRFGIELESSEDEFFIRGGQKYTPTSLSIEGDWSGAAFFLVAGALRGKIRVRNLSSNSFQGDKEIISVLKSAGANIEISDSLFAAEANTLNAFRYDATRCPDLVPPLSVLAIGCVGESEISGVSRLVHKESNRAKALIDELGAMGAKISLECDTIRVKGSKIKGGEVTSHGDHRIAMACAIAALISDNGASINGWESVSKSYPGFFDVLDSLRTKL